MVEPLPSTAAQHSRSLSPVDERSNLYVRQGERRGWRTRASARRVGR